MVARPNFLAGSATMLRTMMSRLAGAIMIAWLCAGPAISSATEATIRSLPLISSEATVASCGDELVLRTEDGRLLAIDSAGMSRSVDIQGRSLIVFRGLGSRCLALEPVRGLLDITGPVVTAVRAVHGTLPNEVISAAQADDGRVWLGVAGSDQVAVVGTDGTVRYFDLPDGRSGYGTLQTAEIRVPPVSSSVPLFTSEMQLLSASPRYVWGIRSSIPPGPPSYVVRIDPRTLAYRCIPLDTTQRGAGLAALDDEHAAVLIANNRLFITTASRIERQWELPGASLYVAPPWSLNLVTAVAGGADAVSLKDGALWHVSLQRTDLELKGRFPGRPAWIAALSDRVAAINTDTSEFMAIPILQ